MTDKAIFIGMSGAKTSMHELEIVTNNLANANTTGFRADYEVAKQNPINNDPKQTRVFSTINRTYTDFQSGPTINTGRDLDVALSGGKGFIAVQGKGGKEGYTRAGDLQIVNGTLVTRSGDLVIGNGGVINIPQAEKLNIAADGSISIRLAGNPQMIPVDRIKLVSPELTQLSKGEDGLFYMQNGESVKMDEKLRIAHGALEGSNVNTVETLTKLIELSRHFEVHTNLMKTMQENATKANQILELQG
jgi:flagellar basal-body rod protein FlgF